MSWPGKLLSRLVIWYGALSFVLPASIFASELLPPGFRPVPLGIHALVGGKVVIKPGEVLDSGTIVIRDGLIQAVGTNIAVPADARVWDLKGATVYAGFIEPYLVLNSTNPPVSTSDARPVSESSFAAGGVKFFGAPGAQTDMGASGPGYEISRVIPEFRAVEKYSPKENALASYREQGFTVGAIVPAKGIIRGTSTLVALADESPNRTVIKPDLFQHIAFDTESDGGIYPNSLMGVIATIRQTFFDARHYQSDRTNRTTRQRFEFNSSLAALAPVMEGKLSVMIEPGSALMDDRAAQIARELGFNFSLVSCGEEWRRPDLAKATGATFIVPVDFPGAPKLPAEEDWDQITLDQLRAWDWAPENPAVLRQQGLEIALTTYGLGDKKSFRKNLQLALDRGLSETDALAALTTVPAKLCGVEDQLGTIEAGKCANLVVVNGGSYFDPDSKIGAVWIDGRIYPFPADETKSEKADEKKPSSENSNQPSKTVPPKEEPEKHPESPEIAEQRNESAAATNTLPNTPIADKKEKQNQSRELQKMRLARAPLEGRGSSTNPSSIYIYGATVWSCASNALPGPQAILIQNGKITRIGNFRAEAGPGTLTIEARGLHITPGIIDCHSHATILGDVNENGLPSTAMVRISDVVNSESENFYRELAGGVTTINLLHGSANPIGGQNCVIKLRDGDSPEKLIFSNAPPGIKFALGENVKQANWGEKFVTRFPQTRMGVRTFIQNRFVAAQEYLKSWEEFRNRTNAAHVGQASSLSPSKTSENIETGRMPVLQPRRDLELEAISEILQGRRWIHCHAYRQDEMLMLTRLMQGFGVQIGTFQHGLEAYKIADELAAADIGVSTFSDWWALKYEMFDAIPYNGSLLHDRGVLVSFNSDFSELARRLYLEAAKAVKCGGTSEPEALKFITLNPAKQLRIDKYIGSLEPGKDADFVIWSKSPLDSETVCLQTWVDGKKYFDRELDAARTARLKQERSDLIAKAKKVSQAANGSGQGTAVGGKSFFHVSLEHQYDGVERRCEDE